MSEPAISLPGRLRYSRQFRELRQTAKALIMLLSDQLSPKRPERWFKHRDLAEQCGARTNKNSIGPALQQLEAIGFLKIVRTTQRVGTLLRRNFKFKWDEDFAPQDVSPEEDYVGHASGTRGSRETLANLSSQEDAVSSQEDACVPPEGPLLQHAASIACARVRDRSETSPVGHQQPADELLVASSSGIFDLRVHREEDAALHHEVRKHAQDHSLSDEDAVKSKALKDARSGDKGLTRIGRQR